MVNETQKAFWGGDVGARWVGMAPFLDATFTPVTRAVADALGDLSGAVVLDVGCGAGALSRVLAARAGQVHGIDISPAFLAAARARAPGNADYTLADAETDAMPGAPVDAIASQFGMMFFTDTTAALANLRRAARPGARLAFATWAASEVNPWFSVPRALAVAATGPLYSDPDAPGPMRLRDVDGTVALMRAAGWQEARGRALDIALPQPGTLEQVAYNATRVGGASSVLGHYQADKPTRSAVTGRIAQAFAPWAADGAVHVPARINLFTAVA